MINIQLQWTEKQRLIVIADMLANTKENPKHISNCVSYVSSLDNSAEFLNANILNFDFVEDTLIKLAEEEQE